MKSKHVYLVLCLAGTVLPLAAFLPFLGRHGLDGREFVAQLFGTPVSSFFGWDVIISSLVLWAFVFLEGRRLRIGRLWAPIAANLLVGVSLGLPLFLYMRELRRESGSDTKHGTWDSHHA
jgi:Terpene cyclase DEP1